MGAAAVVSLALAAVELGLAWAGVAPLARLVPGTPPMVPVTAASLLFLSVALLLRSSSDEATRRYGKRVALPVLAIPLIVVAEHLGLDLYAAGGLARPAENTSAALGLLALAVLAGDGGLDRRVTLRDVLALSAGGIASGALTGYAYRLEWLYGVYVFRPTTGMALDTALGLALLSLAAVASAPDRGLARLLTADGARGDVLRRFLAILVLVPFTLDLFLVLGSRSSSPVVQVVGTLLGLLTPLFVGLVVWYGASAMGRMEARLLASRRDLEVAEERFRLALRTEPRVMVFSQDRNLQYEWVQTANPEFRAQEYLGKTDDEVLGASNAQMLTTLKRGVLETGHTASGELSIDVRGRRRHYQYTFEPRRDATGRITGLRGAGIEVTSMRELLDERAVLLDAERAARGEADMQRAQLEQVLAQLPEGVIVADAKGRTSLNAAAKRYVSGETRGMDRFGNPVVYGEFRRGDGSPLSFDELPLVRAIRDRVRTSGEELSVSTPSGWVPLLASAGPIEGPHGENFGAVVIFQDISTLKELERQREEWTSVVAHDFRQPLATLDLSGALLERVASRSELPAEGRSALARIRAATLRLTRMTGDLLDASRIESRRLALERRLVDIGALVEDVVEEYRQRDARVSLVREGQASAWADPDRIRQVLTNLLSNAVKYGTPDTGITVTVRGGGDAVEVGVANEGASMTAEELGALFQRFYRAPSGRHAKGIGLGLYIAKGLVEAHGGRIDVDSRDGRTEFRFSVPAHAEARPSPPP